MPLPYRILHRFTIPLRCITPQNYALAPRYDSILCLSLTAPGHTMLCHCLTQPDLAELHHASAIQCITKRDHALPPLCITLLFSSSHSHSLAPLNRLNHAIPLLHATSPRETAPRLCRTLLNYAAAVLFVASHYHCKTILHNTLPPPY